MQTWTIIVDTFREARDKKLFWVLLVLSTLVAAALACVGFDENGWSLMFGAVRIENSAVAAGSPGAKAVMASIVSEFLIKNYIGRIGVLICLIATAGMFPALLEGGAIEVTLSKPISRLKLFAGKYAGCLVFVLVQATYFVLLTLVILRWQLGFWYWSYLWAIPLLVAAYSYIHCVSVLTAVMWRSTLVALMTALLFWLALFSVSAIDTIYHQIHDEAAFQKAGAATAPATPILGSFGKSVALARTGFPKIDEIPLLLGRAMGAASTDQFMRAIGVELPITPAERYALDQAERRLAELSAVRSLGTSLLFELGVLLIAWWVFQRRDF